MGYQGFTAQASGTEGIRVKEVGYNFFRLRVYSDYTKSLSHCGHGGEPQKCFKP